MQQAFLWAALFTLVAVSVDLPKRTRTALRDCLHFDVLPYLSICLTENLVVALGAFFLLHPVVLGPLEPVRFLLAGFSGVFGAQEIRRRRISLPILEKIPDLSQRREAALEHAVRVTRQRRRARLSADSTTTETRLSSRRGRALLPLLIVLSFLSGAAAFDRSLLLPQARATQEAMDSANEFLRRGDLESAQAIIVKHLGAKDPQIRAEAGLLEARILQRRRRPTEARDSADAALRLFEEIDDPTGRSQALRVLGQIVHDQGDRAWAEERYREALRIAQEHDVGDQMIAAWVDLAILRGEESDLSSARELLAEALLRARQDDSPRYGGVLGNEAEVLRRAGESTTAARRFEEARKIFRENSRTREEAWTELGLGDVHRTLGDLDAAESHYRKAQRLFGEDDPTGLAWARRGEGALLLLRGDLIAARSALEESLASHRARGENRWAAVVRLTLAEVSLAQDRPREAAEIAAAATQELEREGRRDLAARGRALGAVAKIAEDDLAAAQSLLASVVDARNSEEISVRLAALHAGALMSAARGEAAAEELARRMLDEARASGSLAAQFEARRLLIEIEAAAAETLEDQRRVDALTETLTLDAAQAGHHEIARRVKWRTWSYRNDP